MKTLIRKWRKGLWEDSNDPAWVIYLILGLLVAVSPILLVVVGPLWLLGYLCDQALKKLGGVSEVK